MKALALILLLSACGREAIPAENVMIVHQPKDCAAAPTCSACGCPDDTASCQSDGLDATRCFLR
jgi:hypothetical protein